MTTQYLSQMWSGLEHEQDQMSAQTPRFVCSQNLSRRRTKDEANRHTYRWGPMSGEGTGFAFRHSPYKGSRLIVHLAIGDVVNDAHDNEFWMSVTKLAQKCRLGRSAVIVALADLVADGFLEVLAEGGGRGRVTRYRFLMPQTARFVDGLETVRSAEETARSTNETARSTETSPLSRTKEKKENADAAFVAKSVFDASNPKPAQPFIAILKIAQRLLDAGHHRDSIIEAMLAVPTISVGWVEAKLNGRTNGKATDTQAMIDRRFGFGVKP